MHTDWISERRVLVTGGAGFIGSCLVRKLVSMGCDVVVADNLSRGSVRNLATVANRISLRTLDITNLQNCNEVAKDVDCIFHLASAVGGVQYIRARNVDNLTPSVLMNANMAEAARKSGAERFLFTSSACVYHDKNASLNRFKEIDAYPANPPTTYGWAKVFGELLCKAYHDDYGMKTSAARIFNAYGEGENLEPRWSHVIPSLIRKAILHPSEDFTVFGDGSQARAFLYVDDCVQGLLQIMVSVENGQPINLGSDEVTSIKTGRNDRQNLRQIARNCF